jgi:hypothetical protein
MTILSLALLALAAPAVPPVGAPFAGAPALAPQSDDAAALVAERARAAREMTPDAFWLAAE